MYYQGIILTMANSNIDKGVNGYRGQYYINFIYWAITTFEHYHVYCCKTKINYFINKT